MTSDSENPPSNIAPLVRMESARSRRRKGSKGTTGAHTIPAADATTVHDFREWLMHEPDSSTPFVIEQARALTTLLDMARINDIDLNAPASVDSILDVIFDDSFTLLPDDAELLAEALHEYVHFRLATSDDPEWDDAHDVIDEATNDSSPGADALATALESAENYTPDELRAAASSIRIVWAVRDLLEWIGTGRQVTASGGIRRADIQEVAGMLGISAIGVSKIPDAGEQSPRTTYALSVHDIPALSAWWYVLALAGLIEVTATRVRPGPGARAWLADDLPPLERSELVVGAFVAELLRQPLGREAFDEVSNFSLLLFAMFHALTPEAEDELQGTELPVVENLMRELQRAGLVEPDAAGDPLVPDPLRSFVARGVLVAMQVEELLGPVR